MTSRLLIVDDEAAIGFALSEYFACSGWETDWVASLGEAKAQVRAKYYTAAIIDLCLSGGEGTEGLEVLDELHRHHPRDSVHPPDGLWYALGDRPGDGERR